jgi:hypothetical protein
MRHERKFKTKLIFWKPVPELLSDKECNGGRAVGEELSIITTYTYIKPRYLPRIRSLIRTTL